MTEGALLLLAKQLASKALTTTATYVKTGWQRVRARSRAISGDDLAGGASLNQLVRKELAKLVESSQLPAELRNDGFRNWVLSGGATESFVEVMLAKAGGIQSLAEQAGEELARTYEERTGETSRLALGPINLVVADLYGQLTAPAASEAFRDALSLRTSAQVAALGYQSLGRSPETELLLCRTLSRHLLSSGRKSWRTPEFLAPLTLEIQDAEDLKETRSISKDELLETLSAGRSLVLHGDGGVGKTTFMLELASGCLAGTVHTPLFFDAAVWARTGAGVSEYIASSPAAQLLGISAADIVRLAQRGKCVLMVNGWNEIPAEQKLLCREAFNQLTEAAPELVVVVATRTAHDIPSLPAAMRVVVRGLTWSGQSALVSSTLAASAAESLIDYLARDAALRHAARSPLILHGLIARARQGAVSASISVFDLLGSVVGSYECDEKRQILLDESPLFKLHTRYLQQLAARMNKGRTTRLSKTEAMSVLGMTAAQLATEYLVSPALEPAKILDALTRNHLLQVHDDLIRFAHQRFQEYFAAQFLLRMMSESTEPPSLLIEAVNEPAWAESMSLVAGQLASSGMAASRAMLIKAAASCDISYACDLAGKSGFKESDDAAIHLHLVSEVNALASSAIESVRDLAAACKIASCQPCFADDLWALFESEQQHVRLHAHQLNGTPISLKQLGENASARISDWPPEQRAEFIHEVAGNPDNYEFVAGLSASDPDVAVRTAAIAALFWNYPASTVAVTAWIDAPMEVQTRVELFDSIAYVLEQGILVGEIRSKLSVIAATDLADDTRLRLALAFPAEAGLCAVDQVLARLKTADPRRESESLLAIAKTYAPDRLLALAHELAVSPAPLPEWAGRMLLHESPEQKALVFEGLWSALQSREATRLSAEFLGPLSSATQTRRSVESWMQYHHSSIPRVAVDHDYGRAIADLLKHAPGDDLFCVVMELSSEANYDEAVELVNLLLTRLSREDGPQLQAKPWTLTPEKYNELSAQLLAKFSGSSPSDDRLSTYMACIASHIAPSLYGEVLLDAVRRHLDAWTAYHQELAHWLSKPSGHRPNNPSLGNYLASAVARWGTDALPGLLEMADHPSAMELVPQIVERVAALPWSKTEKARIFRGVGTDIADGRARREAGRALQQPSVDYQDTTDAAARKIALILDTELDRQLRERRENPKWNARHAEFRIGRLVAVAACIPSPEVVRGVTCALGSGLVDLSRFSDTLRKLVRQGWMFSDETVARALEALVERESNPTLVDNSTQNGLAECFQLLFLVEPSSMLRRPLNYYLQEWRRRSHDKQVIRGLSDVGNAVAWKALLELGDELAKQQKLPDDYVYSVVAALRPERFDDFARYISQGVLSTWRVDIWTVKRLAPQVAKVVNSSPERFTSLLLACRQAGSSVADVLIDEVLGLLGNNNEKRAELVLEALDAGRADGTQAIEGMFWLRVPMGQGIYEVHPKACNALRRELYRRAKTDGRVAVIARQALAALECSRRQGERPNDEPRHPEHQDGQAWTQGLVQTLRSE